MEKKKTKIPEALRIQLSEAGKRGWRKKLRKARLLEKVH